MKRLCFILIICLGFFGLAYSLLGGRIHLYGLLVCGAAGLYLFVTEAVLPEWRRTRKRR